MVDFDEIQAELPEVSCFRRHSTTLHVTERNLLFGFSLPVAPSLPMLLSTASYSSASSMNANEVEPLSHERDQQEECATEENECIERRKKMIRQTWRSVELAIDSGFSVTFYQKLFDNYPDVELMFSDVDMKLQAHKLYEVVRVAVRMLDDLEDLIPILQDLGVRHARAYGVHRAHYGAIVEVFGEGLHDFVLDQAPTKATNMFMVQLADAWTWVLTLISNIMADAAEEYWRLKESC